MLQHKPVQDGVLGCPSAIRGGLTLNGACRGTWHACRCSRFAIGDPLCENLSARRLLADHGYGSVASGHPSSGGATSRPLNSSGAGANSRSPRSLTPAVVVHFDPRRVVRPASRENRSRT